MKMLHIVYLAGIIPAFVYFLGAGNAYFSRKYVNITEEKREWLIAVGMALLACFGWMMMVPLSFFLYDGWLYGFKLDWKPVVTDEEKEMYMDLKIQGIMNGWDELPPIHKMKNMRRGIDDNGRLGTVSYSVEK